MVVRWKWHQPVGSDDGRLCNCELQFEDRLFLDGREPGKSKVI